MSRLAAVVLAAGASTRMGRPKPLIEWRGRPFVWHVRQQARAAGADVVIVVEGAVALPRELLEGATIVRNEAWADGPLGSLQVGLRAVLDAGARAPVLVLTVDRPHLRPETLQALAHVVRTDPTAVWQPRLGERRGHPIVYPDDLVPALIALAPPMTPRELLDRPDVAERRRQVEVADPAILDNLDHPQDLERLPP